MTRCPGRLESTVLENWNHSFIGRVATTVVLIGITMPLYMWINHSLSPRFDLSISLDATIPFLPWTIFLYLSFYLMLLVAAGVCAAPEYGRIQKSVLLANFLCYAGFFFFPSHYPRPLPMDAGGLRDFYGWLYANDAPGNTFPSIHAAASLCTGFSMRKIGWKIWGAGIAISILTVKQHFIVDLIGGAAVAALSIWIVRLYEGRRFHENRN